MVRMALSCATTSVRHNDATKSTELVCDCNSGSIAGGRHQAAELYDASPRRTAIRVRARCAVRRRLRGGKSNTR